MKDLNKPNFEELKKEVENLEKQKTKVKQKEGSPWIIGENYMIRTVTMIQVGRLIDITDKELIMEDASWIPDTGRFANFLSTGEANEVEPFPDGEVIIGRGALIDSCPWKHKLLRKVK